MLPVGSASEICHTYTCEMYFKDFICQFLKLFPLIVPSWQLRVPDFHDSNLIYCLENQADVTSAFLSFLLNGQEFLACTKTRDFRPKPFQS